MKSHDTSARRRTCAPHATLAAHLAPTARQRRLLASYLLGGRRGAREIRRTIVADVDRLLDLGMRDRAIDALVALRMLLEAFPEARRTASALHLLSRYAGRRLAPQTALAHTGRADAHAY